MLCISRNIPVQAQSVPSIPGSIPLANFSPNDPPKISADSAAYSIRLINVERCENCRTYNKINFEVKNKASNEVRQVAIQNFTEQADYVYITKNTRAVIIGQSSGSIRSVNIINLTNGNLEDFFFVDEFTISPDGRFIAFTKEGQDTSDIYRIYDVSLSATENRIDMLSKLDKAENAGLSLYNTPNYKTEALVALVSKGFLWVASSEVAFVSCTEKKCFVVDADLKPGIAHLALATGSIDVSSLYTEQDCQGQPFDGGFLRVFKIQPLSQVGGQKKIRLTFEKIPCLGKTTVDVTVVPQAN